MTDEQIEKTARYHADKHFIQDAQLFYCKPWDKAKNRYVKTIADFGKYCIAHQWIPVDERLPEYNTMCLVFGHQDFGDGWLTRYTMMAHYDGENFYDAYNDSKYHPEMWMPIPAIPQLNPENQLI